MKKKILFVGAVVGIVMSIWAAEQLQRGEVTTSALWRSVLTNTTSSNSLAAMGVLSNLSVTNFTSATNAVGDGSGLTNLHAEKLIVGPIPDAVFPATLPALSGANLTALNASQLTVGTVGNSRVALHLADWTSNGIVTPFQFGAQGAPTDDTVAISNALNSGFTVYLPPSNYISKNLYLSNGMSMFGPGATITFKSGSTGYLIDCATATNFHLEHLYLHGGTPPDTNVTYWQSSQGTRSGIRAFVFAANSSIIDVTCNWFSDAGFRFGSGTGSDPKQVGNVTTTQSYRQSPLKFIGNEARGDYLGFHVAGYDGNNVQEYLELNGCTARNCYYGVEIDSGNDSLLGGTYTGNNYGAYILNGGPNNAHGTMTGVIFNHNVCSVFCDGLTTGFMFNGCRFGGGGNFLRLRNCSGVTFQGCNMDMDYGINDGGGTNWVRNSWWNNNDPGVVWTNVNGGVLRVKDNPQPTGNGEGSMNYVSGVTNWFPGAVGFGDVVWSHGNNAGLFFDSISGTGGQFLWQGPNASDVRLYDQKNGFTFAYWRDLAGALSYEPGAAMDLGTTTHPWKNLWVTNAIQQGTASGATWVKGYAEELLTLSTSGTTTDTSANLLPVNSIIESVEGRVTTTITTATDWKLGDATTAGRFTAANATMTAGATSVGLVHVDQTGAGGPKQTSAAKVRVTTTGTPGAGVIRIVVFYRQFTAPTL